MTTSIFQRHHPVFGCSIEDHGLSKEYTRQGFSTHFARPGRDIPVIFQEH
ncbi:MAG: hypothetical protein VYB39_04850 [Pseudomonadota bacterium]|nr:hypothetical protein [Pseudomonadota bacterium]